MLILTAMARSESVNGPRALLPRDATPGAPVERGVSPSGTAAHTRAGVVLSSVRAAARGRNPGGSLSPAIELDSFINSQPLGRFQVRIALFCAAVLFFD